MAWILASEKYRETCPRCNRQVIRSIDTAGNTVIVDEEFQVFGHIGDTEQGVPLVRLILGGALIHTARCKEPKLKLVEKAEA